jgi:hypothetical protein
VAEGGPHRRDAVAWAHPAAVSDVGAGNRKAAPKASARLDI